MAVRVVNGRKTEVWAAGLLVEWAGWRWVWRYFGGSTSCRPYSGQTYPTAHAAP